MNPSVPQPTNLESALILLSGTLSLFSWLFAAFMCLNNKTNCKDSIFFANSFFATSILFFLATVGWLVFYATTCLCTSNLILFLVFLGITLGTSIRAVYRGFFPKEYTNPVKIAMSEFTDQVMRFIEEDPDGWELTGKGKGYTWYAEYKKANLVFAYDPDRVTNPIAVVLTAILTAILMPADYTTVWQCDDKKERLPQNLILPSKEGKLNRAFIHLHRRRMARDIFHKIESLQTA
jgi:hypothetical protein